MMKRVHHYLYLGSVGFFFILLYPLLYHYSRKGDRFRKMNGIRRIFGFLSSSVVGIFYRYRFEEKIDWNKHYIICANHSSNLDITVISQLLRSGYAFMGKEELLDNPVTALFFRTIDIPVNRESKMSAFRAFKRAEEYLRNGITLVIFPEGKIPNDFPPVLHPFKNGPFRLAIEQKVPIIPVSIKNIWKIMWDDGLKYGSRPGICNICVHSPVATDHLTIDDADTLRDRIFKIIKEGVNND
ncbi:MAG TPA: lysophospholipid acyltransferase family protein [Sphingobacteriaceae bacterium]